MTRAAHQTREADVAIVGAGPTGLLLGAELALRGVAVVLLERDAERPPYVRAFNLNARSLELLDRRGIVERFLAEGPRVPVTGFAGLDAPLDLSGLDTDHPYTLGIPQTRTEALLEEHALALGAELRRGHAVADVTQGADGVVVDVRADGGAAAGTDGYRLRARYLVGCDGGRSTVRKRAGIAFPGTPATRYALLGDVELGDPAALPFGNHQTPRGSVFVIPRPGYVRVITGEVAPPADRDAPVALEELTAAVRHVLGRDVTLKNPRWLTRFGNAARLAERFRLGRVFLAGDAAHVHPPAGAQGLNVGLQDAFNLGWKLAAAVHGWAPPGLLDSYHAERHAAGERVLMQTRAQAELGQADERVAPVRALFRLVARLDPVRRALAELVTGLDTRYVDGAAESAARQPWLGRLAPNAPVYAPADGPTGTPTGAARVPRPLAAGLHAGRALFLAREGRPDLRAVAAGWRDRLECLELAAPRAGAASGWLAGVDAALVRPDGHLAWLATGPEDDAAALGAALAQWLGRPA